MVVELEDVVFPAGSVVMAQDPPSDGMLVVCSGRLTASRVEGNDVRRRLRRFGEGTIVGEIGVTTGGT